MTLSVDTVLYAGLDGSAPPTSQATQGEAYTLVAHGETGSPVLHDRGPTAVLYTAVDSLGRATVVKLARSAEDNDALEREARLQRDLSRHATLAERVTPVLGMGLFQGRFFFAMPMFPATLATWIHGQSLESRLAVLAELAHTVVLLHAVRDAQGTHLVHRDLKPSNVMIELRDAGPFPVLSDFGISRRTTGATVPTDAGMRSVHFAMADQALRLPARQRHDVYALCSCVFWGLTEQYLEAAVHNEACLTPEGRRYRDGEGAPTPAAPIDTFLDLARMKAFIEHDRQALSAARASLLHGAAKEASAAWDALLRRVEEGLRPDPRAGQTASAQQIEEVLRTLHQALAPAPRVAPPARPGRRRAAFLALGAAGCALTLVAAGLALRHQREAIEAAQAELAATRLAQSADKSALAVVHSGDGRIAQAFGDAILAADLDRRAGGAIRPATTRALSEALEAIQTTVPLEGHTGNIQAIAISPDATRVATGADDGTARLWDAASGACIRVLEGHTDSVREVVFSPDGKWLATAGDDPTPRLWDAHTGAPRAVLTGHTETAFGVRFSVDGKQVATAAYDESVRLWNASSGGALGVFQVDWPRLGSVDISPAGDRVLATGPDREGGIAVWDVTSGQTLFEPGDIDNIDAAVFSPDGTLVLASGWQHTLLLDGFTGEVKADVPGQFYVGWRETIPHPFSQDCRYFMTDDDDYPDVGVHIFSTASGQRVLTLEGVPGVPSFERDSDVVDGDDTIIVSRHDSVFRAWRLAGLLEAEGAEAPSTPTRRDVRSLWGVDSEPPSFFESQRIGASAWAPMLLARSWGAGAVLHHGYNGATSMLLWKHWFRPSALSRDAQAWFQDGYLVGGHDMPPVCEHERSPCEGSFSPTADLLAVTMRGPPEIAIWDLSSGSLLHHHPSPDGVGWHRARAAWSPDGKVLLLGDYAMDLVDSTTFEVIARLTDANGAKCEHHHFSEGGGLVIANCRARTFLWDAHTGAVLGTIGEEYDLPLASSRDDALLATQSSDNVSLWERSTGRKVLEIPIRNGDGNYDATFVPDGSRLVLFLGNETSVWDTRQSSGQRISTFDGWIRHPRTEFSPDARYMAVLDHGYDGKPQGQRILDLSTGQDAIEPQDGRFTTLAAFSPNSRLAAAGSALYDLTTGEEISTLVYEGVVHRTSFTPDGREVVLDTTNGRETFPATAEGLLALACQVAAPLRLSAEPAAVCGLAPAGEPTPEAAAAPTPP